MWINLTPTIKQQIQEQALKKVDILKLPEEFRDWLQWPSESEVEESAIKAKRQNWNVWRFEVQISPELKEWQDYLVLWTEHFNRRINDLLKNLVSEYDSILESLVSADSQINSLQACRRKSLKEWRRQLKTLIYDMRRNYLIRMLSEENPIKYDRISAPDMQSSKSKDFNISWILTRYKKLCQTTKEIWALISNLCKPESPFTVTYEWANVGLSYDQSKPINYDRESSIIILACPGSDSG